MIYFVFLIALIMFLIGIAINKTELDTNMEVHTLTKLIINVDKEILHEVFLPTEKVMQIHEWCFDVDLKTIRINDQIFDVDEYYFDSTKEYVEYSEIIDMSKNNLNYVDFEKGKIVVLWENSYSPF